MARMRRSGGYSGELHPLRFRVTVSGELAEYLSGLEPGVRSREVAFLALAGKRVLERGAELAAGGRAVRGEAKAKGGSVEPERSADLDWMSELRF
ncbi:hypothetical protein BI364_07340 [Acidihalobacter yilgarnensis]|uniref:Uncharacterized protein n=1 Tax=Acidihalobacter yilgarnensis TaxID=2819280 RepID=A0A1D8IN12_9GAMM|nr:hypothetical protein [Acidihalobacter yilgarnensis]AOU97804.1 hypothetical protein BI364_07340 [Acidihalobacter yilgarnensis]